MDGNQSFVVHSGFFLLPLCLASLPDTVSDPVEFHHVFKELVLSLMQPQTVSNKRLNQHDFLLPLRGCIKKIPVFRDNL